MTSDAIGSRARSLTMGMPEAATFAHVLDSLGAGLFLVEATSRIVHANASARALLHGRSVLRATNDRLVACDAGSAQALAQIVSQAAGAPALGRAIAVPLRARDGEHYIAHVLPLACGARRCAGAAAIATVIVHKLTLGVPTPPQAIAGLYGLTPTELRVLLAIVEVRGVRETAEVLGIGEATVKTHLHRVFGKTGVNRQAELVKLVAGFANPVVGRSAPSRASAQPRPHNESAATGRLAS
jgi:DNA-binding CsgD family transcriptional regulator